jgi:flavin reductase (DIM6/NTAB) family NADH-FMN oxidoreductase RutF
MRHRTYVDRVLDKICYGVAVITAKSGSEINGMAASWFSRVSGRPYLVMVAVSRKNYSLEIISNGNIFAINILGKDQIELGRHFGKQSGRDVDKFASIPYESHKTGAPILKNCIAFLDCCVIKSIPVGDHILFIGEVVEAKIIRDEEPLMLDRRDFFKEEM